MKLTCPHTFHFPGVTLHFRNTHRDNRGALTVLLDVPGKVARAYVMMTHVGMARDIDTWHVHAKQHDRFYVLKGHIILGLSDGEKTVSLFLNEGDGYLVSISPGVYHCFRSLDDSLVLNFPDSPYDPVDELRVPFDGLEVEAPW